MLRLALWESSLQGLIQKYDSPEEILRDFFDLRIDYYGKRKAYMVSELDRQLSILSNKVRFITEVVKGTLIVSNRKKSAIVEELTKKGYNAMSSKELKQKREEEAEADEADDDKSGPKRNFDYLLSMPILSLSLEKVQALQADRDSKAEELDILNAKTPADLWNEDLEVFDAAYADFTEAEERAAREGGRTKPAKDGKKGAAKKGKGGGKKRKNSWGGSSDESESECSDEDDFVPKKKKSGAASKPAAPKGKNGFAPVQVITKPPPVVYKEPKEAAAPKAAPPAKKQDRKASPDKEKMAKSVLQEEDDDDVPTLSLFDRLNAKMSSLAPAPKASAPAAKKAAPKKKSKKDDSESEEDEDEEADFAPIGKKKAPAAKKAAPAPAKKVCF